MLRSTTEDGGHWRNFIRVETRNEGAVRKTPENALSENQVKFNSLGTILPARGLSFQVRLVALVLLQILVALAAITWLSASSERRAVRELSLQLNSEIAYRIQEHLASFLDTPATINRINAAAVIAGDLDVTDWRQLEEYFVKQGEVFESVGTIGFGSAQGGFVGANLTEGYLVATESAQTGRLHRYALDRRGIRPGWEIEAPVYDARDREWFQAAVEHGGPTWTDITASVGRNRLDASTVEPCYAEDGSLLGVFLVDESLSQIGQFLETIDIGNSGLAFIIDRDGYLVASSTGAELFATDTTYPGVTRILAEQSGVPLINLAMGGFQNQSSGDTDTSNGVQHSFKSLGENFIAHAQALPSLRTGGFVDWMLVVVVPEREFLARLESRRWVTVLLLTGIGAMVTIAGGLAARWFVRPLASINATAAAIARGEPGEELDVRLRGELGELATSLGLITNQLQNALLEQRRTNDELRLRQEQLRSTASEMCIAEERERRRIASDVHGRVLQTMVLARIKAASLEESARGTSAGDRAGQLRMLIQQSIDEARDLLVELSPPVLFELGLGSAAEWLGERLEDEYGIACTVQDRSGDAQIGLDLQIVLFQAIRELLRNVAKHSHAELAQVVLERDGNSLNVVVQDDGAGFDSTQGQEPRVDHARGFGLFNIGERLELFGGALDISSRLGEGTTVSLVVPIVSDDDTSEESPRRDEKV